jgi:hypothetical protein
MVNVSTARKISILARIAARQASHTRIYSAVLQGARTSASHLGRILHQLWLEVTGFVFVFIAIIGGNTLLREYAKYRAGHASVGRLILAVCFTLVFAWFGISSFWKVRKKFQ